MPLVSGQGCPETTELLQSADAPHGSATNANGMGDCQSPLRDGMSGMGHS